MTTYQSINGMTNADLISDLDLSGLTAPQLFQHSQVDYVDQDVLDVYFPRWGLHLLTLQM